MADSERQGTRQASNVFYSRPSSRMESARTTRDVGLNKRLVLANAVFSGSTISDAAGGFAVFRVNDGIVITGTNGGNNNGDRTILSGNSFSIVVDFPVKTEGPTANVEVRTP